MEGEQPIEVEDTDPWERFTLICKPEQSGKTFVMIQKIIKDMKEPVEGKKIVNFIFCDNSLLLTKQTSERVKNDLHRYQINGELYIELSSHRRTIYHNSVSVIGALTTNNIYNVICCTNGARTDDIYDIIDKLNTSDITRDKFIFKIWLDEADKYDKVIDSTFIPLVNQFENIYVYLITATPKKLFDKYTKLNVLPIENTTSPEYHGWNDNIIKVYDHPSGNDFVRHILDTSAKDLILPGTKWFIPAGTTKKSHKEIKNICAKKNMATFIVNGDGISIHMPDMSFKTYKKDRELNDVMMSIYKKQELVKYAVAITGNICIGRGISIISKDFMIDYGILSRCNNQQEASQNSGRLKGNIKGWSSYKQPTVFTTEKFNSVAKEWEKKSRGLAKLAFMKEAEGKSTMITKNEFKTVGENYEIIIHPELFTSYAAAQKFLRTKDREMRSKKKESKKNAFHTVNPGGYIVTSKLLKGKKTVKDLCPDDRLTLDMANKISAQTCISSTLKGSKYLVLPVYDNMDSPPKSVQYQVRYISFKK
jgi:hypothetical protein